MEGEEEAAEATRDSNGILYSWVPAESGAHIAELTLITTDKRTFEKSKQINVIEPPTLIQTPSGSRATPKNSDNATQQATTKVETTAQIFQRRIGNNSSCTESNVVEKYDLCLASDFSVTSWEGRYQSLRNGSAVVERHPSNSSCVVLTLKYSDSGKGFLGDCKGNGWVDYAVTVKGEKKTS